MSVVLFKDGEQGVFEVNEMPYLLENGWSTDHDGQKQDEEKSPDEDPIQDEPQEESSEEIRAKAKKMGIMDWDKKRIKTLKIEMKYEQ